MAFARGQKGERMTREEAVNWLINIRADIGQARHSELWHYEHALAEIIDLLETEPEIIIRCKDCIFYSRPRVNNSAWCSECRMAVNEDEYCSRAERRTDDGLNQPTGCD